MPPVLELRGITKAFPGVLANDHIDLTLEEGEVHALLGENGAGKTTLMNILYGLYDPDEGEIVVRGETINISDPGDAIRAGIGMVHQHFMLVYPHTVAENIVLGLSSSSFLFPAREVRKRLREFSERYGLRVDPRARVETLSAGEQQRVEILKVLYHEPKVLLLDEPTSLLTPGEADHLFIVLRAMTDDGKGVVFITHKMREVFAVSDRVTVLKLGKTQGTQRISETTVEALTRKTFGELVPDYMPRPPTRSSENAVVLDNVVPAGPAGQPPAPPINLTIRKGEIFGIAGVAGNGQSELIACLTGLKTIERGAVRILGTDMTGRPPRAFIELGVAHIPEQRREIGIVEPMFVAENVVLKDYRTAPFSRRGVLNQREITRHTEDIVSRFNALVPDLWTTESRILSGGNIQRLILGRETWRSPPVIVASHPTEGLDARAIRHTWELFLELRAAGSGILVVSEDLDEIMSLADRIGVLFQGQLMGPVDGQSADREQLGRWMAGSDEAHVAA